MRRRTGLTTLPDAVEWLTQVWEDRPTPTRLHVREHDGWGLMYAPAFARHLDARHDDTGWVTETRTCRHPRLETRNEWECPDCQGAGTYSAKVRAYLYPTWRALTILRDRNLEAWELVLTFVINAYSVADVARLGHGEGALLTAIRRLFDCYERAPIEPTPWTAKSQSQQMAEVA